MSGLFAGGDSCGPVNPLASLSKHATDSGSNINHFRGPESDSSSSSQQQQQQQQFNTSNRFLRIDNHLDQEFTNFQNPSHILQHQQFQPVSNQPTFSNQYTNHHIPTQNISNQSHQWASDFSKLSINNNNINNHNNIEAAWSHQYNEARFQPTTTPIISSTNLLQPQREIPRTLTEHQEIHRAAIDHAETNAKFDTLFSQIESEILKPSEQQEVKTQADYDKEKFAKTAQLVVNAMSSKTKSNNDVMTKKFENSNFLKLMNKVSQKNVVINEEGDGFMETVPKSA